MARVPVEIAAVTDSDLADISSAVALANARQQEYVFGLTDDEFVLRMKMHAFAHVRTTDAFDLIDQIRSDLRGYRPYIIAAMSSHMDGRLYGNLFGGHDAVRGVAAITTSGISGAIIPSDRMVAYFIYYFARYTLSFLSPAHKNHEDSRGCVFDRKVDKRDLLKSMRSGALCDQCRRSLTGPEGRLSARQFAALDSLFALAGRIVTEGLDRNERARIFVGSSSEGLNIANNLQKLLSDEFSVVVWNQGTVFGLGESTLEALEAAVLEYHAAVFVFTPDDQLYMRGQTCPVARDNVIFELGMFVGKLGRRMAFVVHPDGRRIALPSDLSGITTAPYSSGQIDLEAALRESANRIRAAVRQGIS